MTGKQRPPGKPKRHLTPLNGGAAADQRTPIERAVDKVTEEIAETAPVAEMVQTPILVHAEARKLAPGGTFTITTGTDPGQPIMFVGDNGAWRAIFAEPGTQWEVRPAGAPAVPRIWMPGMQS